MSWKQKLKQYLPEAKILFDMADLGLALVLVDADKLWEQDENARTMPRNMFNQLTQNVTDRGGLESVPFCALTAKAVEIVSGHHRIRSLRAAKNKKPSISMQIPILLDTTGLTRSDIRAKQLAHNSIEGTDDPQMLKQIYLQIDDANLRLQAFIDESKLDLQIGEKAQITPLSAGFTFEHVKLFFLPHQLEDFEKALDTLEGTEDKVYLADHKSWSAFRKAINKIMAKEDIRSVGTALGRMSEIILNSYGSDKNVAENGKA